MRPMDEFDRYMVRFCVLLCLCMPSCSVQLLQALSCFFQRITVPVWVVIIIYHQCSDLRRHHKEQGSVVFEDCCLRPWVR